MITKWFSELAKEIKKDVIEKLKEFTDFNKYNDPHWEHDMGFVKSDWEKFMFKIDYYDKNKEYGSEDPSDASVTTRVMTILMSSEY